MDLFSHSYAISENQCVIRKISATANQNHLKNFGKLNHYFKITYYENSIFKKRP